MKFSSLNVDFISPSPDPLESRFKEACARGWLFIRCCLV